MEEPLLHRGSNFKKTTAHPEKRDPLSVWCNMHLLCILAEKTSSPVMIAR